MEIIIDEHCIEAIPGETILELAKRTGIYIPNLCDNSIISERGSCRLCIVELKTSEGIQLVESCKYAIKEKIVVRTSSPLIEGIRRNMINLMIGLGDISPDEVIKRIDIAQISNNLMDASGYFNTKMQENSWWSNIFQKGMVENPQLAYIIIDAQGIIREINQAYLDIIEIVPDDTLGKHILELFPNSELPEILKTGRTDQAAFWTINGHDTIVNRVPLIRNGEIVGALGYSLFLDLSAAQILVKKLQEREKEFNDFLQGLLENPYLAYVIVDRDGYITAINQTLLDILGLNKDDAIGKFVMELMPNSELPDILKTGRIDRAEFFTVNRQDTVVNRMPITRDGEIVGAVAYSLF